MTDLVTTTPQDDSANLLAVISRAASDPTIDVAKMEHLFALHERMAGKQAETEFNGAMARVQSAMGRISADATNPQTRSNYATYGKLDKALRPIYTKEGLSLSFDTEPAPDGLVGMLCYVSHTGGHTRTYKAQVPSDGKGAKGNDVMTKTHAFGSGTSYGMRYLLKMIFNVAIGEEDDDGNGSDALDAKALGWIEVAQSITTYPEYQAEKTRVLAAYGGKPGNMPPQVREAFNVAAAETKPKD
jgi:hypothetical protein